MKYAYEYLSPLGKMVMASDEEHLIGLWFEHQKYFGSTLWGVYQERYHPIFGQTKEWLDCYFRGEIPDFTPPILLNGSTFSRRVLEILLEIPYGQTMTYKEIAVRIAKEKGLERMSAQAVGGAVGHNPISIIIPCHRVVGSNGSLTGYAGGLDKKVGLLTLEKVDMEHLFPRTASQVKLT